jgi:RNA polymerase sigma factor (sigma-70 family)
VDVWLESPYVAHVAARAAYRCGLSAADVPDVLQELRIALWKAGPDLLVNAAWVSQTANHKAQDILRQIRRAAAKTPKWSEDRCPAGHDPELLHLLRARVDLLPKKLRKFYRLRFLEGMSEREISARMGLCRSSVRRLERRCLKRVAGQLPV